MSEGDINTAYLNGIKTAEARCAEQVADLVEHHKQHHQGDLQQTLDRAERAEHALTYLKSVLQQIEKINHRPENKTGYCPVCGWNLLAAHVGHKPGCYLQLAIASIAP